MFTSEEQYKEHMARYWSLLETSYKQREEIAALKGAIEVLDTEGTNVEHLGKLVYTLQQKIHEQKRVLTFWRESNEALNKQLDVLHNVWCNGGCTTGMHRFDGRGPSAVTPEIVKSAISRVGHIMVSFADGAEDAKPASMVLSAIGWLSRLVSWAANRNYRDKTYEQWQAELDALDLKVEHADS